MKSTSLTAKGKGLTGFVVAASAIAAVGGILFRFDTGVISGAILLIAKQWSLASRPRPPWWTSGSGLRNL
jgi:MFS transporter, SP family, galactose:H+ symporter